MVPKRKSDPRSLYVSRRPTQTMNDKSGNTISENNNRVVSGEAHASTSHVQDDLIYDAAATTYFSSDESNDDNQVNNREVFDHNADEPNTSKSCEHVRSTKVRGETTCKSIHLMPTDKVIGMERNVYGQFIGDGKVQLSSFLGTLIRNVSLFPMISQSWTHVSSYSKETSWNLIKASELGKEPTRLELYIDSRTSKRKGKQLVDAEATSKKAALEKAIEEQVSQSTPETSLNDIHEAAFRSTFGEEYYGRCRGMGIGVTALQVYPELSRRSQTTGMKHRNSRDSQEIDKLKLQMTTMQTTIDFLLNAISRQGSTTDNRSGTSAECGIHLSPDHFMRMMSLIRGQNPNNETTSNDTPQTNHITRISPEEGEQGENNDGIS